MTIQDDIISSLPAGVERAILRKLSVSNDRLVKMYRLRYDEAVRDVREFLLRI